MNNNMELYKYPFLDDNEEVIEMNEDFNLDNFQVVRREFFAHIHEPSVTFNNRKFYVNAACLARFPNTYYVQALINPKTKILALRPCDEGERGAFQWCINSSGRKKPRQTTCTLFFLKMFDMMDWNPAHRYKMLGNIIHANGEYLLAFDLTSTEVYQSVEKENGSISKLYAKDISLWIEPDEDEDYEDPEPYEKLAVQNYNFDDNQMRFEHTESNYR